MASSEATAHEELWKPEEDLLLKTYIQTHGEGNWAAVFKNSGLKRGGKSCRQRWKNYLRPDIKHGDMSEAEQDLIIRLHKLLGNRWSLIAGRLPGRTDNEVKNYWNTHLNKKRHRGKKRADDSSDDHESNKKFQSRDSTTSIAETVVDVRKEESGNITEELGGFDCDLDFSNITPGNSSVFGFDDEPFMGNLDSFVLLGALDCGGSEPNSHMP